MKHFVIIAQIRTGYQYLSSLLHSHPSILILGEIFVHPKDVRTRSLFGSPIRVYEPEEDPVAYVENHIVPYAELLGVQITGFKINYRQWQLWDHIKDHDWKVIHLMRRNLLDRLISEKLAIKETKWNFREYTETIEITAEELRLYSEDTFAHWQAVADQFSTLDVYYEDLVGDTPGTIARVLQFLEVEQLQLSGSMTKQRTGPQSKYISNYRELYSELMNSNSPHRKYLTDIPLL